jgi:hypothetical protein
MSKRRRQVFKAVRPVNTHCQLDELGGHVGLGMKGEALRLARQRLRRPKITATEFNGALEAILVQGERLKRWKPVVEAAYGRLSGRDKRTARAEMLGFYHSLKDWESAYRFLPVRSRSGCDLMFAMETLLNLRKEKEAKAIRRRCLRMLDQLVEDSLDKGALLSALGDYHAQIGEPGAAEEFWGELTKDETFAPAAWSAVFEIEALRGLLHVWAAQLHLEECRKQGTDEQAITLPRNRDAILAEFERDLKRYEQRFYKILPKDELWRYGWNAETAKLKISAHARRLAAKPRDPWDIL